MNTLITLQEINLFNVFITVVTIVVAGQFLYKTFVEDLIIKHGWESKKMRQRREDHELLTKTAQNLALLQEKHEKDERGLESAFEHFIEEVRDSFDRVDKKIEGFYENQTKYRSQSLEIQKRWSDKIEDVCNRLDEMQKRTDERFALSEKKTNKRVQSDIKERIAQSYRRYNISKKITHIELEALEDLIETYENYGGENSFVHSIVQKEMYTWEIIE